MSEKEYKNKRALLVEERLRLMNILESQMDFPNSQVIAEYEKNKREIINLDEMNYMAYKNLK